MRNRGGLGARSKSIFIGSFYFRAIPPSRLPPEGRLTNTPKEAGLSMYHPYHPFYM